MHKAFEYLEKSVDADKPDVRYVVRVRRGDGSTTGRGIYLREPLDTLRKLTFMADVNPTFHEVGHLMASPEIILLDARAFTDVVRTSCPRPARPIVDIQSCTQCNDVRTSIWTPMQATRRRGVQGPAGVFLAGASTAECPPRLVFPCAAVV